MRSGVERMPAPSMRGGGGIEAGGGIGGGGGGGGKRGDACLAEIQRLEKNRANRRNMMQKARYVLRQSISKYKAYLARS